MTLGAWISRRLRRPPVDPRVTRSHRVPRIAIASLAAVVAIGGCANVPSGPHDGSPVGATDSSGDAKPAAASSDAATTIRPGLAAATSQTNALGSIVVTNPLAPRTLDLTRRADDIWERIRTGFGVPNLDTPLVAEQQAWFLAHPDYLRRSVERSSRYLFHIVEELNKRGMPTELALLPFIESAYNPMAYSQAHASGMWQFVPGTGKDYNLKQDWWSDDRRDVVASTDAALTYLQSIYEMHGDWHLALASYNWGENAVKRAIDRNQAAGLPTDYLSLPMPDETRNYVPKLQAIKNIVANPEAFGVTLPRIVNEPYFVAVSRDRDIDVVTAAKLANMSVEDFRALNPSFNRPVIRASSRTPLLVPADRVEGFRTGLADGVPLATWQAHTVKRRETVERIAAQYGMTSAALRQVNGLPARGQVRPGQALLVQKKGEGDVALRFASFVPPTDIGNFDPQPAAGSYQVKRGDSVASIAHRFGITPAALTATNRLKGGKVTVGQRLEVPAHAPATAASAARDAPRLLKVKATAAGVHTAGRAKTAAPAKNSPPSHGARKGHR